MLTEVNVFTHQIGKIGERLRGTLSSYTLYKHFVNKYLPHCRKIQLMEIKIPLNQRRQRGQSFSAMAYPDDSSQKNTMPAFLCYSFCFLDVQISLWIECSPAFCQFRSVINLIKRTSSINIHIHKLSCAVDMYGAFYLVPFYLSLETSEENVFLQLSSKSCPLLSTSMDAVESTLLAQCYPPLTLIHRGETLTQAEPTSSFFRSFRLGTESIAFSLSV